MVRDRFIPWQQTDNTWWPTVIAPFDHLNWYSVRNSPSDNLCNAAASLSRSISNFEAVLFHLTPALCMVVPVSVCLQISNFKESRWLSLSFRPRPGDPVATSVFSPTFTRPYWAGKRYHMHIICITFEEWNSAPSVSSIWLIVGPADLHPIRLTYSAQNPRSSGMASHLISYIFILTSRSAEDTPLVYYW